MIRFSDLPPSDWAAVCQPLNEVLPATGKRGALYIGAWVASVDEELLAAHNIHAVVALYDAALTGELPPHAGRGLHRIAIRDSTMADIRPYLDAACQFIAEKLSRGENVLVHCQQGISRSASIVIAYLMREHKLSYDDALQLLKSKRSCVKPNSSFEKTLREWQKDSRQQGRSQELSSDVGFLQRHQSRRTSSCNWQRVC